MVVFNDFSVACHPFRVVVVVVFIENASDGSVLFNFYIIVSFMKYQIGHYYCVVFNGHR